MVARCDHIVAIAGVHSAHADHTLSRLALLCVKMEYSLIVILLWQHLQKEIDLILMRN